MRVLLTGGAGFIGRHVLHELLARGHEVRVLDSLRPDVHGADGPRSLDGAELHIVDVRDAGAVDQALGWNRRGHPSRGEGRPRRRRLRFARLRRIKRGRNRRATCRHGACRRKPPHIGKFDGRLRRRVGALH